MEWKLSWKIWLDLGLNSGSMASKANVLPLRPLTSILTLKRTWNKFLKFTAKAQPIDFHSHQGQFAMLCQDMESLKPSVYCFHFIHSNSESHIKYSTKKPSTAVAIFLCPQKPQIYIFFRIRIKNMFVIKGNDAICQFSMYVCQCVCVWL